MITALRDVKRELLPRKEADTSADAYLLAALRAAERRFVAQVGFDFTPRLRAVALYDAWAEGMVSLDGQRLDLTTPLLAVDGLSNGGAGALDPSVYRLISQDMLASDTPYSAIALTTGTWAADGATPIVIDGIWGYHAAYAEAWIPSGDALVSGIGDTATSLTVTDADAADGYGQSPRFSPGMLIAIEDEWLEVLAVNTTTNTLTARRGVHGSLAAAHDAAAAVSLWQADAQAVRAICRWVALHMVRRGAFETLSVQGVAAVEFPADMPQETARIAAHFRQMFDTPFLEV